ncbi:uncharacterized protein DS421_15g508820 [Arachis hypogaea]|nr:uncharacterized protein DS421_15g508820 [Arachis hypogaea]
MDIINEWIHITIGTSEFDVLVKEVGHESYGVECKIEEVGNPYLPKACEMVASSSSAMVQVESRDPVAELVMAVPREEETDKGKVVISEDILNEWSYCNLI